MGTGDVLLLLGLGFHLASVRVAALAATSEAYTVFQYLLKVLFSCHTTMVITPLPQQGGVGVGLNDGTGVHR